MEYLETTLCMICSFDTQELYKTHLAVIKGVKMRPCTVGRGSNSFPKDSNNFSFSIANYDDFKNKHLSTSSKVYW
jgi:hypothetical protein